MVKKQSDKKLEQEKVIAVDIGQLLCEARDNLGLTTENIASELNLANEVIVQIENNVFEQAIPLAFIRGYIKSYSTKVGLDTAAILKEYDSQTVMKAPLIKKVKIISKFGNKHRDINSSNYLVKTLSILIIVLFIGFAGWEIWKRYIFDIVNVDYSSETNLSNHLNEIALNTKEPLVASNLNENADEQELELSTQPTILPLGANVTNDKQGNFEALDSRSSQPIEANLIASESDPAEPINLTQLVFDFSADCWVKIVDARGEVIALGVKVIDKHMSIEGVAPFEVILGDPSVVVMTINGIDHDLSSYKNGTRAKFTIE